ncbi:unnamed protein product [Hermetia illucens]|uniref:3',5'-cyclic-GMP phosphodiesterase n=1 Tax=Hermetia illucens TaxID=343691 RepID=A0A7R8UC85_HERIL|nr:unnamed protein product [Hermetia illucens]
MNVTKDRCYMVDIKLVNCAAEWIALSISQKEGQRLNEGNFTLNMKLRSYVENYFLGRIEHIEFISKVMLLTKNIIGISRVFFYTTHTRINTYNSYADLYEDVMTPTGFKMVKHPQQFKLHREKGLASYVVRTGLPINYTYAADNAIRLDAEIQKVFHFPLKNSLCMPVKYNNNVIAVIQLLNKKDDKDFTEYDEIILERICMYVSLVQHFEKIKELCELEYARCEIIEDQIGYQLTTLATVPLYIKLTEADLPEGFNDFAWYPEKNEEMLVPWFFYMFKATCSDMIRDEDDLYEFIVNIMKCHRALPFRNFLHTFDALHLLYCIVQRVGERLTKLETFALFLGGCCDGLNSEGFSSQYYTVINHPIIRIYDPPHFRNFQLSFLKRLLTMNKLLDHLSEDDRNKLMKLCGDAVVNLSSSHGGNSSVKLKKILDEGKFDDENPQHRSYQLTLLMRCACKGRVAKPFRIAKRLCEDIYRELYAQGDYFKTMKLIPPTWMDRQNVLSIPENEVEYIKVKCLPIYELLKRMFPSTAELYNLVRELQKAWKLMIELRYKKAWNPDESIGKGLEDTTR